MKRDRGFTLIELLVVIAIISTLAAIIFPVFATAREKARQITCVSNIKQIGTATLLYSDDYDERYPSGRYDPTVGNALDHGQGWAGAIYEYCRNAGVLKCSDDGTTPTTTAAGVQLSPVSYLYNYNIPANHVSQAAVYSSSNTVLFFEGMNVLANIRSTDELPNDSTVPHFSATSEGLNVLASVEAVTLPAAAGTALIDSGVMGGYTATSETGKVQVPFPTFFDPAQLQGRHIQGGVYCMADLHARWLKPGAVSPGHNAVAPIAFQDSVSFRAAGSDSGQFRVTFSTN
jgi:prepilin-type N-terminal cleavage/methylation domain-containing protein